MISRIWRDGMEVRSGWIGTATKLAFRSRSAQFVIMYQISAEMFTFAADGDVYFEKAVAFSEELFHIWAEKAASHSVTIILFSRRYLSEEEGLSAEMRGWDPRDDEEGRLFIDFYKVLSYGETVSHWKQLLCSLKEQFLRLNRSERRCHERRGRKENEGRKDVRRKEDVEEEEEGGKESKERMEREESIEASFTELSDESDEMDRWSIGELSHAYNGNLLEGINLAISKLDKYCIDRDLTHTGEGRGEERRGGEGEREKSQREMFFSIFQLFFSGQFI